MQRLRRICQILFLYTLLVILWGAWVRISHSGDGCGDTWPLCHGQLIPQAEQGKTWVEYFHRAMSGIYGLFVFAVWLGVRRTVPKPHPVRLAAALTLFFTVTEALLGAKLVLFGLVSSDSSFWRTAAMSLHQLNSLLLTGSTVLLILATSRERFSWRPRAGVLTTLFVTIAITGAWAALASTLFPSETLWAGLMKDFDPASHHLLRLRILHPLLALLGGGGLAVWLAMRAFEGGEDREIDLQTSLILFGGILFGVFTLLLLSPVWMKITHLALAHLMWAALIRWALRR